MRSFPYQLPLHSKKIKSNFLTRLKKILTHLSHTLQHTFTCLKRTLKFYHTLSFYMPELSGDHPMPKYCFWPS